MRKALENGVRELSPTDIDHIAGGADLEYICKVYSDGVIICNEVKKKKKK